MNRRRLLAALAGTVIAPDELWSPQRTIFLPPRGGWPASHGRWYRYLPPSANWSAYIIDGWAVPASPEELEFYRRLDQLDATEPVALYFKY